jgi:hypothetical protein
MDRLGQGTPDGKPDFKSARERRQRVLDTDGVSPDMKAHAEMNLSLMDRLGQGTPDGKSDFISARERCQRVLDTDGVSPDMKANVKRSLNELIQQEASAAKSLLNPSNAQQGASIQQVPQMNNPALRQQTRSNFPFQSQSFDSGFLLNLPQHMSSNGNNFQPMLPIMGNNNGAMIGGLPQNSLIASYDATPTLQLGNFGFLSSVSQNNTSSIYGAYTVDSAGSPYPYSFHQNQTYPDLRALNLEIIRQLIEKDKEIESLKNEIALFNAE